MLLYFDNHNASIICTRGSNKPRLQKYAVEISNICRRLNLTLHAVWIPRSLNTVADIISKYRDDEDYSVTKVFYEQVCADFGRTPVFDGFANTENTKCSRFFSLNYCIGTSGADAFLHDWSDCGLLWLFPPPRLVVNTVKHLRDCKAIGYLLYPQWKNNYYYTFIRNLLPTPYLLQRKIYNGTGCFTHGADLTSHFGPQFKGNIEIVLLDFTNLVPF